MGAGDDDDSSVWIACKELVYFRVVKKKKTSQISPRLRSHNSSSTTIQNRNQYQNEVLCRCPPRHRLLCRCLLRKLVSTFIVDDDPCTTATRRTRRRGFLSKRSFVSLCRRRIRCLSTRSLIMLCEKGNIILQK